MKRLLEDKNMTQAEFADYIGVGRPSITHIMTGRDKSSQTVVSNTLLHFPEINPMWLLKGEGEMYRENVERTVVERLVAEPEPKVVKEQPDQQAAVQKKAVPTEVQSTLFPEEEVADIQQPVVQSQVVSVPQQPVAAAPAQTVVAVQPQPVVPQQPQPVQASVTLPQQPVASVLAQTVAAAQPQPVVPQQPQSVVVPQPVAPVQPQSVVVPQSVAPVQPQPVQASVPEVKEVRREKKLKKIVFFYDDRSFEEFLPSSDE